jgi:hypothetical protein
MKWHEALWEGTTAALSRRAGGKAGFIPQHRTRAPFRKVSRSKNKHCGACAVLWGVCGTVGRVRYCGACAVLWRVSGSAFWTVPLSVHSPY